MDLKTAVVVLHLVGLVIGLGAATVADVLFMGCLLKNRMNVDQYGILKRVTDLVLIGLLILGVTGFGFVAIYANTDPHLNLNPKLWAKVGIIVVLSINGFFMHDFILPLFARNLNRPLFSVPVILRNRFFLFACGAISMTSWYSVMVLGVWKQANFKYTYGEIFGTYALLCLGAVISSPVLGRVVIVIAEKISPRAVQDAKDARPIWGPEGDVSDGGACFSLLRKELCRANRQSETMTVLSFSFNTINEIREAFGNIAAEQSEKEVTELLYNQLRDHDHLAYLGSGQYLLILPVTDTSSAGQVVNRLGRAAGQYRFKVQDYNHFGEAEPLAIHFEIRSVTSSPQAELKAEDLLQVLAAQPVRLSSFIRDYEASTQPVALTLVA